MDSLITSAGRMFAAGFRTGSRAARGVKADQPHGPLHIQAPSVSPVTAPILATDPHLRYWSSVTFSIQSTTLPSSAS